MEIFDLIRLVIEKKASDLHISVGVPPTFRIAGNLVPSDLETLTPSGAEQLVLGMLNDEQKNKLQKTRSIDFTYSYIGRFRVNVYMEKGYLAAALRIIPFEISTLQSLRFPPNVTDLARKQSGLIIVTGARGSGKSTTLAAMIDLINTEQHCHIITIEDPIEYLHPHKNSIVNQREVYSDTLSFSDALRDALGEDPDVILVGEMHDLETISAVMNAAETGHLVFASLGTPDTVQSIDRIIDGFPENQQSLIRLQTSLALQGVISQRLIPRADGKGMVAAVEVLTVSTAVANLIRDKKTNQIYSRIETGAKEGMRSLNQSLAELCRERVIRASDALAYSNNPELLRRMLL